MDESLGLKSQPVKDYCPMARRILILHSQCMSTSDPFVEGLRRIFSANPDMKPSVISVNAGLDNSTIRKLISGANSSPKIDTANRIAEAMGYQLADIIAIGAHEDPSLALDWLRLLDEVTPDVREEAIKYALFLQSQNLSAAAGAFTHAQPVRPKQAPPGVDGPAPSAQALEHAPDPLPQRRNHSLKKRAASKSS